MSASFETGYETDYGTGILVWRGDVLIAHKLPRRLAASAAEADTATELSGRSRAAQRELGALMEQYFRGESVAIGLESISLQFNQLSSFERRVSESLAATARGELISYGELALRAGFPGAARAVGNFMAKNPWPIIIPCHRVIRGDGGIGGFASGREWKQRLIALEAGRERQPETAPVAKTAFS